MAVKTREPYNCRAMRHEREKIYIYGKHALMEALTNTPRVIRKVFLSHENSNDRELRMLLSKHSIPSAPLRGGREASRLAGEGAVHQGIIAAMNPSGLMREFKGFLGNLEINENTVLVVLAELTDPHNVGAIIRSAAAFGVAGVLIPSRNQAPITGAVVKASAGMAFRVPLVSIGNVNYALDALKEEGFRSYALAMQGAKDLSAEPFDAPAVIVVGNEGRGIREKTMERADTVLKIPMHARAESLNASVAAAVVLYAWSAKHPEALRVSKQ